MGPTDRELMPRAGNIHGQRLVQAPWDRDSKKTSEIRSYS